MKNFFNFFFVVIIVIIVIEISYFFYSTNPSISTKVGEVLNRLAITTLQVDKKTEYKPELSKPDKKSTPKGDENIEQPLYKNIAGKETKLGIFGPITDANNNHSLTLIGILKKFYQSRGKYFAELAIPWGKSFLTIKIDLGSSDYMLVYNDTHIADENTDLGASLNLTEPVYSYYNTYQTVTTKSIAGQLQENLNRTVKIDILTEFNSSEYEGTNCTSVCKMKIEEFSNYEKSNLEVLKLLTDDSQAYQNQNFNAGAVILISLSK